MDENLLQYAQQEFNLPHDVVKLPSEGKFYKSKKKSVKVGYLTAADENVIMSVNPDDLVMTLVRSKLYEPDLRPDEMLNGDIEAILIFLRNTSFGPEYKVTLNDPQTGKSFEHTLILDELNIRRSEHQPDEYGLFTTTLPKTGATVKLKVLSFGENIELGKLAEQYPTGRVAPTVTWRLMKQIVEVNGDQSKEKIAEFVNVLPIMDSKYIRQFIRDNAPSLDLTQTVKAPSGEMVKFDITFGVEFFRPFF
jgi:hypothetical protein